jgi:flagellar basal-body rod modification protein FlgD
MNVSATTAKETRDQFMQLLVTQLQNQDPLSPMKQEEFLSQLAQFSTLEGIENLNETIGTQVRLQEESLRFQQLTQAATLVGAEVTYTGADANGVPQPRTGVVNSVAFDGNQISFQVDGAPVRWSDITSVQTAAN